MAIISLRHPAALLPITTLLAGCSITPHAAYSPPSLATDSTWEAAQMDAGSGQTKPGTMMWWRTLDDPRMTGLIDRVTARNPGLAAAGLRLRRARLSLGQASQRLRPTLTAEVSHGLSRPLTGRQPSSLSSSAMLATTWELDLFGRLAAQRDMDRWEAQASEHDLAATRLALVGSTASAWWQLALANERIALGDQSLMNAQRTFDIVSRRYQAGAASAVEIKDAEQSIASQEGQLIRLQQARTEARHALAALLGEHVYNGPEPKALPTANLPDIPAGLPSELLVRRPDLAAAQARLRRAVAAQDAALADTYPRLALTGSAGGVSSALGNVLRSPTAGLSGGLTFPFLDARRVRLAVGVAKVDYQLAAEQFCQTFYDALRDIENALSNRAVTLAQGERLVRDLSAARQAESLYAQQYKAGAVSLRTVLDAQERRRVAQNAVLQNRLDQLNAQMALYMALGGEPPASHDASNGGGAENSTRSSDG